MIACFELTNKSFHVSAIVDSDGILLSLGLSQLCSHVKGRRINMIKAPGVPSIHAEADALYKLRRHKLKTGKKLHMLVIRTSKMGELACSKPCAACTTRIMGTKRKYDLKVCYSTGDISTPFKFMD